MLTIGPTHEFYSTKKNGNGELKIALMILQLFLGTDDSFTSENRVHLPANELSWHVSMLLAPVLHA